MNIKNQQMWNTICVDARINISKSLFGLRTTATYNPTNSVIDAKSFEYSPADGERLKRLLETPHDKLTAAIGDFRPKLRSMAIIWPKCVPHAMERSWPSSSFSSPE